MQLNVSSSNSDILSDDITRSASQRFDPLASDYQVQQGSQSSGIIEYPHGRSSHMSSVIQDRMHAGNHKPMQHSPSTRPDGNMNVSGYNDSLGLVASAVNANDAAKDIMGTLRSKHTNLASELEVAKYCCLSILFL